MSPRVAERAAVQTDAGIVSAVLPVSPYWQVTVPFEVAELPVVRLARRFIDAGAQTGEVWTVECSCMPQLLDALRDAVSGDLGPLAELTAAFADAPTD